LTAPLSESSCLSFRFARVLVLDPVLLLETDTPDPALSLGLARVRAPRQGLGFVGELGMAHACAIRIGDDRSEEVAPLDATYTVGALALVLVPAPPFAVGPDRLIAWDLGDALRAISVVVMAARGPGATLFAPAAPAQDPRRVLALARALLIHPTRGIAGVGAVLVRVAEVERV